MKKRDVI